MMKVCVFLIILNYANIINCDLLNVIDPFGMGPTVKATKGDVWPEPQISNKSEDFLVVRPKIFKFKKNYSNCTILDEATVRYLKIIQGDGDLSKRGLKGQMIKNIIKQISFLKEKHLKGFLNSLTIDLNGSCTNEMLPTIDMVEDYKLDINLKTSKLTSNSVWGILRGLETFSQLIYLNSESLMLQINYTQIEDYPRFPHRGLHLDTARHFIEKPYILKMLDAMSFNKLNVFHWHMSDDQSFPYQSIKFPEMSKKGAYTPSQVYTQDDIAEIIEHARLRGIRVLPEFTTPGHTTSWGAGVKDLLTPCYNNSVKTGKFGPIDPTKEKNFVFLKEFFEEISQVFPENFIHLGGDEVTYRFPCWASNPDIVEFMAENNIKDFPALQSYYMQKLVDIVDRLNASSIVWEDVLQSTVNINLPQKTIIHVWKDDGKSVLNNVTKLGRNAIYSSCWYLDYVTRGGDWINFYQCDATDFSGDAEQKALVLGGEVCMWTEFVNKYNLISRVWPRACAPAERLWSSKRPVTLTDEKLLQVSERLEEHTCRMNRRGIEAQPPNAPGFCL